MADLGSLGVVCASSVRMGIRPVAILLAPAETGWAKHAIMGKDKNVRNNMVE
jgi:hypothetical protein